MEGHFHFHSDSDAEKMKGKIEIEIEGRPVRIFIRRRNCAIRER